MRKPPNASNRHRAAKTKPPVRLTETSVAPPEAIAQIGASHAVTHVAPHAGSHVAIHARTRDMSLARTLAVPRKATGAPRPTAPNATTLAGSPVATSAVIRVVTRARATVAPTTTPARLTSLPHAGTTAAPTAATPHAHPVTPTTPTRPSPPPPPARTTAACVCPS